MINNAYTPPYSTPQPMLPSSSSQICTCCAPVGSRPGQTGLFVSAPHFRPIRYVPVPKHLNRLLPLHCRIGGTIKKSEKFINPNEQNNSQHQNCLYLSLCRRRSSKIPPTPKRPSFSMFIPLSFRCFSLHFDTAIFLFLFLYFTASHRSKSRPMAFISK